MLDFFYPLWYTILRNQRGGIIMTDSAIEKAINSATVSVETEGFFVDREAKALCRKLLKKEISLTEYIAIVKKKAENRK